MIQTATLSAYRRREGWTTVHLLLAGCALSVLLALTVSFMPARAGVSLALLTIAGLVIAPCVWRWPQSSAYMLLFAAVVIEERPLGFGISLTDQLPAFIDIQSLVGIGGLALNPIECLTAFSAVVCLLKFHTIGEPLVSGPLLRPFALLFALIVIGMGRGYMAGGDMIIALWGIRGLGLMFLAYLLTVNVIKTPAQLRTLAAIFVLGAAFKGLIGLWRFVIDVRGQVSLVPNAENGGSLMAHEESFFFALVLGLAALSFVFVIAQRDRRMILLSCALTALPLLANQRRAAIAGLVFGLIVMLVLLYAMEPRLRASITKGVMVALVVLPVYGYAGWNHDAVWTTPVQAIKSGFQPDERDLSSNEYREIENENLRATASQNRLLGIGFGLPMTEKTPMPDIGATYSWYLYLPHNNLLWLGMTMGLLGLTAFSYLIANLALRSVRALVESTDAESRLLFSFGLLAITLYLVFSLLDQGLFSQRIDIFMGVLAGVVCLAHHRRAPLTQALGKG